jgi:hypothetical protein
MHSGYKIGSEHERQLASWMERLGMTVTQISSLND